MIVGEHPLKDLYREALWGPGRRALEALPAPLELDVLRAGGRVAAEILAHRRGALQANLALAFPDAPPEALRRVAARAFQAHLANQYISFSFQKCGPSRWERYLRFEGLARLQEAWARGRGVVLAHPHMGPAQLPLHVLGLLGWPMHQIGGGRVTAVQLSAAGQRAAETRRVLERRMPVTLHDGRRFLRPVLRALQKGEVLMTAADATGGGEELGRRLSRDLLGQPWPMPVGPVWLAWTSEAPLLTVVTHRGDGDGPPWVAEIGEEVVFPRDQGREAALSAGVDALARWLERCLRSWPGDWLFWDAFHPGALLAERA